MSSTSGNVNGSDWLFNSDESSSITNTLFTSPFSQPPLLQTTPQRTKEEAWRQISLACASSSAQAPFGNSVPHNSMLFPSSTAAHDPTSFNFTHPMMQNYDQLLCYNGPFIINPNQGLSNASSCSSSFGTSKKKRVYEFDHRPETPMPDDLVLLHNQSGILDPTFC